MICTRNWVSGPSFKFHYPVPNLGNWYTFFSPYYWWNWWKSRYLQILWRNSILQGRFNFSHFRWRTIHIWYHGHIIDVLCEKPNFVAKYWVIICVHVTLLSFFFYLLKVKTWSGYPESGNAVSHQQFCCFYHTVHIAYHRLFVLSVHLQWVFCLRKTHGEKIQTGVSFSLHTLLSFLSFKGKC